MFKKRYVFLILSMVYGCNNAPKIPIHTDLSNENYADIYRNNYNIELYSPLSERVVDTSINYFPNLQAIKDTLNRFDKVKHIFYSQDLDYNICIDKFQSKRIGIVSTSNFYILTREDKKDWELLSIDSAFGVKWRYIGLKDINGDGFKDIKSVDGGGGYGMNLTYFHIYNSETKRFAYNPHFDGSEVSYNTKTHLVQKLDEQPRYSGKARYIIEGDSLILVDNLEFNGPENEVVHNTYRNGQLISTKKITKSIQSYFQKTLWKSH